MNAGSLPTGTVTFLFTDIEGSTRLWQQHPAAMKDALVRHHALLQQAIESNNGYVFQIVGDASDAQVTATVLAPPRFSLFTGIEPGTNRGYIQIANVGQMRAYVQAVMGN